MARASRADYRALAAFRYEVRRFLAFSERAARDAGIEPQQHQLLLAVRGLPKEQRATIGAIAERLVVQHHTVVSLVDRLEDRGLIKRERNDRDRREVLLRLTDAGDAILTRLSAMHQAELRDAGPRMVQVLQAILDP